MRQLQAKPENAVAFVCSLGDFCSVMCNNNWKKALKKISESNKRTGIFVLTAPPTPENTARLLLTSPVFGEDRLNETAVIALREGNIPNMYRSLKDRKWDACVFLNAHTKEQLRGLLLHVIMQHPERVASAENLEHLTNYLYEWLCSPNTVKGELFPDKLFYGNYTYSQIYQKLQNQDVWNQFVGTAMGWTMCSSLQQLDVAVIRDCHSYAGRCMRLQLPAWIIEDKTAGKQAAELLASIKKRFLLSKIGWRTLKLSNRSEVCLTKFAT